MDQKIECATAHSSPLEHEDFSLKIHRLFINFGLMFFILVFFLSCGQKQTHAATTYDLATSTNWNIRIDGEANSATSYGDSQIVNVDINQDGNKDLVIQAYAADFNGRTDSGSLYIIYSTLLSSYQGTGNVIDLTNSSKYNIRIDGAGAGDWFSLLAFNAADVTNDGKVDLIVGAPNADNNSRSNSGSVWVLSGDDLDNISGTGNTLDLAVSSSYFLRIDGGVAGDSVSWAGVKGDDVTGDGVNEILVATPYTDFNSRSNSGALYIIGSSLVTQYSGTGNTLDLSSTSKYTLRIDGAAAADSYAESSFAVGDIDDDNSNDIVFSLQTYDYNSRSNSGSAYVITNALFSNLLSGTGNTLDLNTSSNYKVRFDGAVANDRLGHNTTQIDDIDNIGGQDLILDANGADNNSRNASGSLYILLSSYITSLSGTGNTKDLVLAGSYNIRIDGAAASDVLGYHSFFLTDYNNNGLNDLIVAGSDSRNARSNSGSLYLLYDSQFNSLTTTGNTIDLNNSNTYSIRFDGATTSDNLAFNALVLSDINNDNAIDLIIGSGYSDNSSRTNSGSAWIIYNFPHTLTNTQVTPTSDSIIYKGTISASNSVTAISGVQYQVDGNSPSGGWSACTADDGAFDSTSEAYTCQTNTVSNGSHTIYVRAYDANTSYTAQSNYGTRTVSIGDSNTASSGTNDAPQIVQSSDGTNATGGVMSPVRDSHTNGQNTFVIIEPKTFNFSAFVSAQSTAISTSNVAGLLPNPFTGIMPTAGKTKTNAVLAGGSMLGVKTGGSVSWQVGNVQQIWYKAYAPTGSDKSPAKIIPELQKKQSIVALSYTDANLVPPGKPKSKFNTKTLKLAHSVDGITWKILPSSVVDTKNHTVAALHKVGGYYMVVGR